jgi:hypothetical protein
MNDRAAERLAAAVRREPNSVRRSKYHGKDAIAASAASHCWIVVVSTNHNSLR